MLTRRTSTTSIALAAILACLGLLATGGHTTAQDDGRASPDDLAVRRIQAFGLDNRDLHTPRTGPSKHRTTSGRVRRTRLVVWLIEGSSGMNQAIQMPSGLRQHKGSTAIDLVSKTLHARSQGLRMAFEIWRGNDVALGNIAQPVGHVGRFDSGDDSDMASVQAWLEGESWGTSLPESNRKWHGSPDLIPSLKRAMAGQPDSIILVAGSMPVRPSVLECPGDVELGDWVVEQLRIWSGSDSIPQIHVLGIGLDGTGGAFFERLASATQGTLTEVGSLPK
jgi:hypothetical protein